MMAGREAFSPVRPFSSPRAAGFVHREIQRWRIAARLKRGYLYQAESRRSAANSPQILR
jgi:hypothetical protein